MSVWILAGAGVTIFLCVVLLLVRIAEDKGQNQERARASEDVSHETKKQAEKLVEHRTDGDVVSSLRRKAAHKREREAAGKR